MHQIESMAGNLEERYNEDYEKAFALAQEKEVEAYNEYQKVSDKNRELFSQETEQKLQELGNNFDDKVRHVMSLIADLEETAQQSADKATEKIEDVHRQIEEEIRQLSESWKETEESIKAGSHRLSKSPSNQSMLLLRLLD